MKTLPSFPSPPQTGTASTSAFLLPTLHSLQPVCQLSCTQLPYLLNSYSSSSLFISSWYQLCFCYGEATLHCIQFFIVCEFSVKLSKFKKNSNITGSLTWLHRIPRKNCVLIKLFQSELSHCLTRMPGGLFSPFRKGEVLILQLSDDKHNYKYDFLPGIQRPLFGRTLRMCQMWKSPFWEVCLLSDHNTIFEIT